ncbi:MAG: hypothetical protein SGCHY_004161 [Lobulomycetales sp.]
MTTSTPAARSKRANKSMLKIDTSALAQLSLDERPAATAAGAGACGAPLLAPEPQAPLYIPRSPVVPGSPCTRLAFQEMKSLISTPPNSPVSMARASECLKLVRPN